MTARLQIVDKPEPFRYFDVVKLPAGSMWREPENDLPERVCWCIVLPDNAGLFRTTARAGELWDVSGEAPNLTVKPSIRVTYPTPDGDKDLWHGFITNGEITP